MRNFFEQNESSVKFTYFDPIFQIFPDNLQSNSRVMSITGYDTNCILTSVRRKKNFLKKFPASEKMSCDAF